MFKQISNNLCNNVLFSSDTIVRMHDQVQRLYEAARLLRNAETPSAVARLVGASPQTIKNWESRGISIQGMLDAEDAIGCRAAWLRTGAGEMLTENERARNPDGKIMVVTADSAEIVHVRSVSLALRAGFTGYSPDAFEEDGAPLPVSKAWLTAGGYHLEDLVAGKVGGHSMSPSLNEGDIAVIHLKSKKPVDGKVFAVNFDGEPVIKRLVKDYNRWFLYSDNPDQQRYRPQEVTLAPNFIIGQVVLAHKYSI